MDNKLPLLRVRMFGKERITYGNEQIIFEIVLQRL